MITNYFIPPHPSLQIFVDNYILSTSEGKTITLSNTWPASNETSLIFYMADQPVHFAGKHLRSALQDRRGCVVGLQSQSNGVVSFKGIYHTFIIQFKANGFGKLFQLPAAEFVNTIHYLNDVLGKEAAHVNEALLNAKDMQQMAGFADAFLLHFLTRQKPAVNLSDGITFIANELFSKRPLLSVEQYASKAAMSVRNFGRRFTEQTGVSPKFYCRLLRFNNAVNEKLKHPRQPWTSIAYECGYYDQMHLIKDFKEFAGTNPSHLFQANDEFIRPRKEAATDADAFDEVTTSFANEKFITIKRTAS